MSRSNLLSATAACRIRATRVPSINARSPLIWFILSLSLCAAGAAARAAVLRGHGLKTEYFVGEQSSGTPALTIVSAVSTRDMVTVWKGSLPPLFHARWSGYLNIIRSGRYTFATTSDDGSFLTLDGIRVVENGGSYGAQTRTGEIDLISGPHFVVIEYTQEGGAAEMAWLWAEQGSELSPVPRTALSPQRLSDRAALVERRLDQLFVASVVFLGSTALWTAFVYAGRAMARQFTLPLPAESQSPAPDSPRGWRFWGVWIAVAGVVLAVASVPAYRSPWSETLALHETSSRVFVTGPLAHVDTPYISSAALRFAGDTSTPLDARPQVILVRGAEPIVSADDVNARALMKVDADLPAAVQFRPAPVTRVAVLIGSDGRPPVGQSRPHPVQVTLGYDGRTPAVSVIHYWWPWIGGFLAAVTLFRGSPLIRRLRTKTIDVLAMARTHQPLLWLLLVAVAVRFVLAMSGGQYFDMDELRYGAGTIRIFDLLSTGNVASALDALLDSPDHPGFRIVGLVPAFFHVLGAWSTGHPLADVRHPSGEWLAAFVLSLAAVGSIALTYLAARRAGAPRHEASLAAFLMFASTSMLIYTRQFFPYDAAIAVLMFTLWIGLKSGDHPLRSYAAGCLAGFGFLTYEGYWLMTGAVGLIHVLRKPLSPRMVFWRGVLFSVGVATLPTLLVLSGILAGQPFLQGTMDFSTTVVHGDFAEGWSLPWKYLWDVEGVFVCIYLAGIIVVLVNCLRRPDETSKRGLTWLLAGGTIYAGLVIGSNGLHRFVVYDRLTRQMLPFMCLASVAGITSVMSEWLADRRAWLIYGAMSVLFVFNALPIVTQRFPREIANDAIRRFGAANVRLGTMVLRSIDESSRAFLPEELNEPVLDGRPKRYVLLNARDIWIDGGPPGWIPPPEGKVLLSARHPRQLRSLQYHGYTPGERALLRRIDLSIQLIDTGDTVNP